MSLSARDRAQMASNNARLLADPALQPMEIPVANMRVKVHVREKTFVVSCGDGGQRISWLANVGIVRYDEKTKGMELGAPRGVRIEDGTKLNMDDIVCTRLQDGADVWVILKDLMTTDQDAQRDMPTVGSGFPSAGMVRGESPALALNRTR
mmetsp:Transcript_11256/g.18661  ORF Transcript_11256/g.18661 Transcript_11256/m.18661 type:complete len:151 (-) Transcript_11256:11-463(-)